MTDAAMDKSSRPEATIEISLGKLQQEFPRKPLADIDAGLCWKSPEMIAQHRAVHERAIQL